MKVIGECVVEVQLEQQHEWSSHPTNILRQEIGRHKFQEAIEDSATQDGLEIAQMTCLKLYEGYHSL